jgi:hypothetical protein
MTEQVLESRVLLELRKRSVISDQEVAIQSGDIFYAKNVLSNEKRMIDASLIININKNESVVENVNKTLLKG